MNDNCKEYYDCSIEPLLLHSNKPFYFCSKDTHLKFILIHFNKTFQITGLLFMSGFRVTLMLLCCSE